MVTLAADAPAQAPLMWWQIVLAVLTVAGPLLAAGAAVFVAWRGRRKSPHERLESLVSAYADWPESLPGKALLVEPIAITTDEVRRREGIAPPPSEAPNRTAAPKKTERTRQPWDRSSVVAVVGLVLAILTSLVSVFFSRYFLVDEPAQPGQPIIVTIAPEPSQSSAPTEKPEPPPTPSTETSPTPAPPTTTR